VLPQLIDKMTPTGQVSGDHADVLQQALSAFAKRT